MDILIGLIAEIWRTLNEASFYILLGIFFAGVIGMFISKEQIAKHLGQRNFKSVLLAALGGIPLPLCSCGVVPTAMSLRKSGASRGSTLSFLISTPETGVDSIALSFALLDPVIAVFRPMAAFVTALVAGVCDNIFDVKDNHISDTLQKDCPSCGKDKKSIESHQSLKERFVFNMKFAFLDLLGDIGKWFLIGIALAGIISYFVPESFISNTLSQGWQAMVFMLFAGIPMYICASASTPIAAALILKGMSPGVALVFLLVGPATNAATILMVDRFLGRRSAVIYLLSLSVCAVFFGMMLNLIYTFANIDAKATLGHAGQMLPEYLKTLSSVVLLALMGNAVFKKDE